MKTILKPPPPPHTHIHTYTHPHPWQDDDDIFLLHNNFISTKKLCRLSWNTSKSLSLDFHTDNAHISICCLCIIVRDLRSYIITAKSFLDLRLLQTLGVLEEKKVRVITRKHSLDVKSKINSTQIELFAAKRTLRSPWHFPFHQTCRNSKWEANGTDNFRNFVPKFWVSLARLAYLSFESHYWTCQ